jgi:hypothetical protein
MSVFQKKAKSGGACGCRGIKHKHTIVFPECLSQPVYTQKNVTAEDNSGIKVVMFEGEGPKRRPEGGEWEPIKIPHRNLAYIPKPT